MPATSTPTLPPPSIRPAPAAPGGARRDGAADGPAGAADTALTAAREFEKLLIHDMLKSMRRAGAALGDGSSNARATYDDMLDEQLAGVLSEAGGLGLAPVLAAQLGAGTDDPARAAADDAPVVRGLATADLLRLRALAQSLGDERGSAGVAATPPASIPVAVRQGIVPSALRAASAVSAVGDDARSDEQRAFLVPLLPYAQASARRLGTSPDAVLAVAALESGWGRHVMRDGDGASSHNLFGIKARPGERGALRHTTAEYLDGQWHRVVAEFRAFADPAAAIDGFADFVLDNPRYATALEHAADPPEFLRRLHAAGYATDPHYAEKAIAVMQRVRALRESLS